MGTVLSMSALPGSHDHLCTPRRRDRHRRVVLPDAPRGPCAGPPPDEHACLVAVIGVALIAVGLPTLARWVRTDPAGGPGLR